MAISIVVPGSVPDPHIYLKCPKCGTVLKCLPDDMIYPDRHCAEAYISCMMRDCGVNGMATSISEKCKVDRPTERREPKPMPEFS